MSRKNKLNRFAENQTFPHVIQPKFHEVYQKKHKFHGVWGTDFWNNSNPIVLELGCGKGEYTVNLAKKYPHKNFIGIDIKGARFWRGAKTVEEENISNVAFLRTQVEFLESFFAQGEISEIWITFPDPQLEMRRTKKRLTSSRFLNMYYIVLTPGGKVHLKTDSQELHAYTKYVIEENSHAILAQTQDVYNSEILDDILSIQTFYEKAYLAEGKSITYLQFLLNGVTKEPSMLEVEDILIRYS